MHPFMKYLLCAFTTMALSLGLGQAAGTLTPAGSPHAPLQIRDHHVDVVINNGFARTTVTQSFYNPNDADLEGIYAMPLPKSASLAEYSVMAGEVEIHGEVMDKEKARQIYNEEKDSGNNAGLAEKESYQKFEFRVAHIPPRTETRIRFVYYQPLHVDTGVGRYLYPLENGGTDELAQSFWTPNEKVEGVFSARVEFKSAWPVAQVRIPGREQEAQIKEVEKGHYVVELSSAQASLSKDLVFYYRLADDLPGRVEVVPFRADKNGEGTFMMVVTPGLDLKPLQNGADYVFVLDTSGSMAGKIHTLSKAVAKTLGQMSGKDRFRLVSFNTNARELTSGWVTATPENVAKWVEEVGRLTTTGGTNIYDGLEKAFGGLDGDRVTSVILVTDGVTNTGVVDPKAFHKLLQNHDVRVFSFVMGNSANWPLMDLVGRVSGGFAAGVSNDDDIIGQILLAKSKILHESLHHAELTISGVKTWDVSQIHSKVYRGQQLVLFGRYDKGGTATFKLKAKLSGEDKNYTTTFTLPEVDTENPELERLWALDRIEHLQAQSQAGILDEKEAVDAVKDLGVKYQIVTDETSMVVLSDASFARRQIERRNQARIQTEHQAQTARHAAPVRNYRADGRQPAFSLSAPKLSGGGAVGPWGAALMLPMLGWMLGRRRSRE